MKKRLAFLFMCLSLVVTPLLSTDTSLSQREEIVPDIENPAFVDRETIVPDSKKKLLADRETIVPDSPKKI
ncbi:hypothetical protein ACSVDE_14820 [Pseudalkalibacillus sp. Hm43]|uniref:hypothetical protein n=1 Tax=Pseudalkalibacillus sp. Hm43 TaxID=3450742 RepID=UPI003F4371AF